jgi:NTP pyrophosphatase (non-canonical NTP hydrolase)
MKKMPKPAGEGVSPSSPNRLGGYAAGAGGSWGVPFTTMSDDVTTLAMLKDEVRRFAADRAWEPFHSPKNLSMSLAAEAAELMEHFLWVDCEASRQVVQDPVRLREVADEMADVACLLLNLSNTLAIDLSQAILDQIARNALKYPVEKYRGRFRAEE